MARHSIRQAQRDELAFPVRVKIAVPRNGLGSEVDAMHAWLSEACGAGNFACHSAPGIACDTAAFYFRDMAKARAFVAAFPNAKLADGTESPAFQSATRRRNL